MDTFADAAIPGATADQQKVLAVVKNNDTEEGADISTDFAHLGSEYRKNMPVFSVFERLQLRFYKTKRTIVFTSIYSVGKDKLQEILNWLSDEGHIYSTIDDDHFKTT